MKPYALVLSNDIQDPEKMLEVTKATAPYIDGIKIGITSSMVPGVEIFKRVKEVMKDKVAVAQLADYKVADIGFTDKKGNWNGTNEKIVRNLSRAGADYITCHTFPGPSSIEECVETAHEHGSKVLTLPYMTHKGANLFFGMPIGPEQVKHISAELKAYGIQPGTPKNDRLYAHLNELNTATDLILALGNHFGVDGYIGPANDPDVLSRYREFTQDEIWSPGFGRQDKKGRDMEQQIKEWAQVVGPKSAMIVGSAIYKADNPAQAAKEIMELRDKTIK